MHPYGGSPICPRCNKAVYAAEQVMGPGRILYHKLCLTCTSCRRSLNSFNLLEHDQQPYCKTCHVKNFGTADLRSGNLPQAVLPSASRPPLSANPSSPSPLQPIKTSATGVTTANGRSRSQTTPTTPTFWSKDFNVDAELDEEQDQVADLGPLRSSPVRVDFASGYNNSVTLERSNSSITASMAERLNRPVQQTSTGSQYGAVPGMKVSTNVTGSPRKWGGTAPSCARCAKSVYFAEQVKAIGKTFHKNCLRCSECNTLLDSSRLRDHDGTPLCARCYNKLHGPAGNGYALLGKAGG